MPKLTRNETVRLNWLRRRVAAMKSAYEKRHETIKSRAERDARNLNATLGVELKAASEEFAELESRAMANDASIES